MALLFGNIKNKFLELIPLFLLFFISLSGNSIVDINFFSININYILIYFWVLSFSGEGLSFSAKYFKSASTSLRVLLRFILISGYISLPIMVRSILGVIVTFEVFSSIAVTRFVLITLSNMLTLKNLF